MPVLIEVERDQGVPINASPITPRQAPQLSPRRASVRAKSKCSRTRRADSLALVANESCGAAVIFSDPKSSGWDLDRNAVRRSQQEGSPNE